MTVTRSPAPLIKFDESTAPTVAFVCVTYATPLAVIDECLDALARALDASSISAEVVVVDNLPPTGGHRVADHLSITTSGIDVLRPDANLGFGGGNELGIASTTAPILCLINPDLIVHTGWLEPLLATLTQHPAAIVSPRLINRSGVLAEAGRILLPNGKTEPSAAGSIVDYTSAACWLLKRSTHERVGGFDPRFHPAYFEDVDFVLRLRRIGGTVVVDHQVSVIHLEGASTDVQVTDISPQLAVLNELWHDELRTVADIDVRSGGLQ
jgi:GT2 family glycosyltransferase